jgi:hypothetical protein
MTIDPGAKSPLSRDNPRLKDLRNCPGPGAYRKLRASAS